MQPFEVIAAPYTCYIAPPNTVMPRVDQAPPSPWTTVGVAAAKSYADTGVTVTHTQTIGTFVGAGGTAIRKAWRQTEELTIAFSLADLSPLQYASIINNAALNTTVAATGTPGDQNFEVMQGYLVNAFSLLVKGLSPVGEAYSAQYEMPGAYNAGNPAPVYSPQGAAVLAVEFHAYEIQPGHLATWRAQTAPHT